MPELWIFLTSFTKYISTTNSRIVGGLEKKAFEVIKECNPVDVQK
jgi:hypothetical protein